MASLGDSWGYGQPAAPDPLGYTEPLPLVERFYPLGFPLELATNSSHIVESARESWGEFKPAFDVTPMEFRIVARGDEAEPPRSSPEGPMFRAQGHLLTVVLGPDNFGVVDMDRGFSFACLAPAVAQNHLFTSFHFLDPMAYMCLSQRYLTPVHAACVARNGDGILLVGEPGAGKSCLAWACGQAGFTFIADDAAWLVRESAEPAVIGRHQRMRFKPGSLDFIPELARLPRVETVIGKYSFEIRTADVPGLASASRCRASKIVFLERQETGAAELLPVSPEETRRRIALARPVLEHHVWNEQQASLEPLIARGAWLLRYSGLAEAVDQLLKLS